MSEYKTFEGWFEKNVNSDWANGLGFYNASWLKKAWEEARKGYVKLEDVLEILEKHKEKNLMNNNYRIVSSIDPIVIEEIKKLGGE